jgi:hypothetical protein
MNRLSAWAFGVCAALLIATSAIYYPKWTKPHTEATISWDVSGYYLYLPAALIYKDLKTLAFWPEIEEKYRPGPGMGQATPHAASGNYVMKYSMGQALQFLPWFTVAHLLAEPLGYAADGFSKPYQVAIGWGSLLVALLGLWVARLNLLRYYTDRTTALALLAIVWGSNYLNYASIDGAMTHNWLFTVYSLLVYSTIQFYERPRWYWAAAIGILCGWATLTRPTEIISVLIPLLWGLSSGSDLKQRLGLWWQHKGHLLLAALLMGAVGSLQLLYWKWATGQWLVYSYGDQGFDWARPHVADVLISARAGWLLYSPMMLFAVLGLFLLWRQQRPVFWASTLFLLLFFYITSAWSIWWYGGSLGARAMVQSYALWVFPLSAFFEFVLQRRWMRWPALAFSALFVWCNLWWTHQAHLGGLFVSEQMTKAYFWKVIGKSERQRDWLKLLDNKNYFDGPVPTNARVLGRFDFEQDTTQITTEAPISGLRSGYLDREHPYAPERSFAIKSGECSWVRAEMRFRCTPREDFWWAMTQFIVRFYNDDQLVQERSIRLQRHVDADEVKSIHIDAKAPKKPFNRVVVTAWIADSGAMVRMDDWVVYAWQ